RDCDVLLVDDLHFLAKKKATQEEFLHTFDALLSDGRQLVLTCDCHPRLNEDFAPELMDRLLGGAVWCLTPPDAPTRREILRAKANRRSGVEFPDAVLDFLAENLRGNVRELEGAIQGVAHFSRVTSRPVDEGLVREALADLFRHSMRLISIEEVDRAICSVLRMPSGSLQGAERGWAISHPRMVGMYLARKYTSVSHADIGKYFGGRNHSTVVAAEKKVREWLRENRGIPVGNRQLPITEFVERVDRELHR
ncbi:MAG: DnaA ATPase domain-containing protein, partial [Gemmataceae bacterium]